MMGTQKKEPCKAKVGKLVILGFANSHTSVCAGWEQWNSAPQPFPKFCCLPLTSCAKFGLHIPRLASTTDNRGLANGWPGAGVPPDCG